MSFILFYGLFLTLPKMFLSIIELRFLKTQYNKKPYILDSTSFKKAANYSIIKEKISFLNTLVDFCLLWVWILFGLQILESLLPTNSLLGSTLFVLLFLFIQSLFSLPFDAYKTLVIDKKFGFAKGGIKLFLADTIKSFLLLLILGGILIFIFTWIIANIPSWEFYAFIIGALFIIGTNLLYPTLIAPLFNKFTPLEDKDLSNAIQNLLTKVGFHSNGVFVMDASRRDGRLNAYFGGIGKTKRVILFDTLLEKIPKDSILAVLGHELGHFKRNDIYKMMVLVLSFFFVLLLLIANLPQSLFAEANIVQSPHSIIVFLLLLSAPIGFYFTPILGYFSRKNEYNADQFGAKLTSNEALAKALLLLVKENNSFPLSHKLYMRFYYTHPPLMARLIALNCEHLAFENQK
ncbi:M48 family metallopeptidase [Helicobacter sp. 11-8110]|uniref:M48 family metallopeptidase n=1 Tax=Helicobacter sp. 11-8110 TaxID=2004997 RepID=UPI000DCCC061|nr:M48 family metallopeptidase [Helicobacter sp. 11-8110]RAX53640.1 peptidase M48 [Helicobacter sp. 11-8110]